jgi:hypothetical protein
MMNKNTDLINDESRELTSHVASMAPIKDGKPAIGEDSSEIDDQGTNQEEAAQILRSLRDNAFDGSDEKLALALGRPAEEIQNWIKGEETIDSDVLLKAKAMANERGVKIE